MRKTASLLALVLFALAIGGCSAPADEPAKKWVAFLDKHRATLGEGKFNVDDFKKEGQPIVDELKKHRDPKEDKILMTQAVLDEWNRANKAFGDAADAYTKDKGDPMPALAFYELVTDLTGKKDGASNTPSNE
ncbi:MAG: hypothetical protein IPK87_12715 [Planctomycetes bacterium]|nr:hypothetical protein [Planctomycetota bacterium]